MTLVLRDMDIRRCTGCFGCWVKTPGECSTAADDSRVVRRESLDSDLLILTSPVIMGFTSALLKCAQDKLIPLLLPYFGFYGGESHHHARYDRYPAMGLLLQPSPDTDEEDIEIITDIFRRDAINFKADLVFSRLTTEAVDEIVNEISGI